jgi:peptidoglycan/LPS O-acetylase OafA/YrhL
MASGGATSASPHPSSATPSWGRRLVGIEGLRGIAALSVVVSHVQVHTANGVELGAAQRIVGQLNQGLTLFFALSGFLLFRPFAAAIISGAPRPPAGRFLRNRALRIYPAYIVILLLASYVLQTTYVVASDDDGIAGVGNTLGPISEWWKLLADLSMFHTIAPATVKTGLGVSWSLTTELCFYLVLPLLAAGAAWLARHRMPKLAAVWTVPAALLVTGIIGRVVAERTLNAATPEQRFDQQWGSTWHAVLERSLFVQADLFAYGAAAAILFVLIERQLVGARAALAIRLVAIVGFLAVALLLVGPGLPGRFDSSRWETSPVAAACAALILWTALPNRSDRPSSVGRLSETRPLHFAGLFSYSVYLWHLPVLWWLSIRDLLFPATPAGFVGNAVLVVALTVALSAATYYLIEAPALRLKKRTDGGKTADAGPPVIATTVHTPTGPDAVLPEPSRD